uniref:Uncharacterized protein n=1 Tax=Arundo donax TaxID=35708 RepID=A0A0A9GYI2_ARUDO
MIYFDFIQNPSCSSILLVIVCFLKSEPNNTCDVRSESIESDVIQPGFC